MLSGSGPIFLDDRFHSQFAVSLSPSRDEPAENFLAYFVILLANCNWKGRACNRLGLPSDLRRQKSNTVFPRLRRHHLIYVQLPQRVQDIRGGKFR